MIKNKFFRTTFFLLSIMFFCFFVFKTQANTGGIVHTNTDCTDSPSTSCAIFNNDNSKLNFGCANCDVQVTNSALSGYVFGENTGWINLAPAGGGVTNTVSGILGGYAWGQDAGWINFAPTNSGVKINTTTGEFEGSAWSQNYGWIRFFCPGSACVITDWRPKNVQPIANTEIPPTEPVEILPNTPPIVLPAIPTEITPSVLVEIPIETKLGVPTVLNLKVFSPEVIKKINIGLKFASTISIIVSSAVSLSMMMFLNPLSGPELFLFPLRLWSLFLTALGIKKRRKPWGTVYDSITKQPLDPVYVSLFNLEGKEVTSCITDLDGRYGFLVPAGVYKVVPQKTNYIFPSKKLDKHFHDEFYQDLYLGDYLNVSEEETIAKNIPMDPLSFDWNEFAKNKEQLFKFYSKKEVLFTRISNWLFAIGMTLAAVALLSVPVLYNIIIFILYVLLFILRETSFKKKARGKLIEKNTGRPLAFAFIRVFSLATNVEISHKVTDKMGHYFCIVPNGKYYIQVENKNSDESYSVVYKSEPIEIKMGF